MINILSKIETNGIKVDDNYLKSLSKKLILGLGALGVIIVVSNKQFHQETFYM